jgi:hypothetical protein
MAFSFVNAARTMSYWAMALSVLLFGCAQAQTVVNNSAVVLEHALHQDKAVNTIAVNTSLAQAIGNRGPSLRHYLSILRLVGSICLLALDHPFFKFLQSRA